MDILLKSLASAVIVGIILTIANFAGPKVAGAISGIPIISAITYVIITMSDKGTSTDFVYGLICGAIATIFFSILLLVLNYAAPKFHWINFSIAYFLCFISSVVLANLTSK